MSRPHKPEGIDIALRRLWRNILDLPARKAREDLGHSLINVPVEAWREWGFPGDPKVVGKAAGYACIIVASPFIAWAIAFGLIV